MHTALRGDQQVGKVRRLSSLLDPQMQYEFTDTTRCVVDLLRSIREEANRTLYLAQSYPGLCTRHVTKLQAGSRGGQLEDVALLDAEVLLQEDARVSRLHQVLVLLVANPVNPTDVRAVLHELEIDQVPEALDIGLGLVLGPGLQDERGVILRFDGELPVYLLDEVLDHLHPDAALLLQVREEVAHRRRPRRPSSVEGRLASGRQQVVEICDFPVKRGLLLPGLRCRRPDGKATAGLAQLDIGGQDAVVHANHEEMTLAIDGQVKEPSTLHPGNLAQLHDRLRVAVLDRERHALLIFDGQRLAVTLTLHPALCRRVQLAARVELLVVGAQLGLELVLDGRRVQAELECEFLTTVSVKATGWCTGQS